MSTKTEDLERDLVPGPTANRADRADRAGWKMWKIVDWIQRRLADASQRGAWQISAMPWSTRFWVNVGRSRLELKNSA